MTIDQRDALMKVLATKSMRDAHSYEVSVHSTIIRPMRGEFTRWEIRLKPTNSIMIGIAGIIEVVDSTEKSVCVLVSKIGGGCLLLI